MVCKGCASLLGCSGTLSGSGKSSNVAVCWVSGGFSVEGGVTGCESVAGVGVPASSSLSSLSLASLEDWLVSWAQENRQKRALWSKDLQILQRTESGQSAAKCPVQSQLKHTETRQVLA